MTKFWSSLERLLPEALRRTPELPAVDYVERFARVPDDDPTLKAVFELGRYKFAAMAADSTDGTQPLERRFEAFQRAMVIAQFLEDIEEQRRVAKQRQKEEGMGRTSNIQY